jgi:hypothetical protein
MRGNVIYISVQSQLRIIELLEVMKIAKSSDGEVGKERTMLDEKRG